MSTIKTLVCNLHAGQVARRPHRRRLGRRLPSALRTLIRKHKPDVVFLTEVRSLTDVRLAAPGYTMTGGMMGGYEAVVVLTRNKTMAEAIGKTWFVNKARDRMHPQRAFPVVHARHKASGKTLALIGAHLWSMGAGWHSPDKVIDGHVAQARDVVKLAEGWPLVLVGGDFNEDLDAPDDHGGKTVWAIFGDASLRFASRRLDQHAPTSLDGNSLLDDVAARGMEAKARTTLPSPGSGADHRPVVTVHAL